MRWKVLASEIVIDSPYMRVRRERIETPAGVVIDDYHVRETRGFVVIFALTADERVVTVRQYKHGIGGVVTELPAGAIDDGETPREAAARELAEETGYQAPEELELVSEFIVDPTNSDGRFFLFLARDVTPTAEPHFDATEAIELELYGVEELRGLVRDGTINVGSHVAGVYAVLDRLGRLGPA